MLICVQNCCLGFSPFLFWITLQELIYFQWENMSPGCLQPLLISSFDTHLMVRARAVAVPRLAAASGSAWAAAADRVSAGWASSPSWVSQAGQGEMQSTFRWQAAGSSSEMQVFSETSLACRSLVCPFSLCSPVHPSVSGAELGLQGWDISHGLCLHTLDEGHEGIQAACSSPDSSQCWVWWGRELRLVPYRAQAGKTAFRTQPVLLYPHALPD